MTGLRLGAVILALVLVIGSMSIFYVDERELAVKFRFGEIIKTDYSPVLSVPIDEGHASRVPVRHVGFSDGSGQN